MTEALPSEVLRRQRDRAIRRLLTYKDEEVDPYLPDDVAKELRSQVLTAINGFSDFVFDLMRSMESHGEVWNEIFLERLAWIHSDVRRLSGDGCPE